MSRKFYVGNLRYDIKKEELAELFSGHGTVTSTQIIIDRETGRSRGFGFVEMSSDEEAQAAIDSMDGQEAEGRTIRVNPARVQKEYRPKN